MGRLFNFSAGPAVLPEPVLEEAKEALLSYENTGAGILEISHRSKAFESVINQAKSDLKEIIGAGDDYEVLFLQGGASLQFYMVPLNLAKDKTPFYINTGMWSKKAIKEAQRLGKVEVVCSSEDKNFSYIPEIPEEKIDSGGAYLYFTSNNTIFGTQFKKEPPSKGLDLVCDASSDFLSRKLDINRYGLIFAGAQKNLGPAGVAVILIKKNLLERSDAGLPVMLSYKNHAENNSLFNTPPVFSIYVVHLVLKWLKNLGGLEGIQLQNEEKAGLLYNYIDESGFYKGTAETSSRSLMNVTFRLPTPELEDVFIKEAQKAGFVGLKGHRSVGGIRASIYNAFPKKGVESLVEFMGDFKKKNS